MVTVLFSPKKVSLRLIGEHQSLVKKDTILDGLRQSNPFRLNRSDWVVCFRLLDKVSDIIVRSNVGNSIPELFDLSKWRILLNIASDGIGGVTT